MPPNIITIADSSFGRRRRFEFEDYDSFEKRFKTLCDVDRNEYELARKKYPDSPVVAFLEWDKKTFTWYAQFF